MTLDEFCDSTEVESLFCASTAAPTGEEHFFLDPEYDIDNIISDKRGPGNFWELTGTVDDEGDFVWDGTGNWKDWRGNKYTQIKVFAA